MGAHGGLGNHIDLAPEQVLEALLERDEIEQASFRIQGDEEIKIAFGPRLAPSQRTEDAHMSRAVLRGKPQDLGSIKAYQFVKSPKPSLQKL